MLHNPRTTTRERRDERISLKANIYISIFSIFCSSLLMIEQCHFVSGEQVANENGISVKDVVDKTEEDHEVSLTAIDFLSAPDTAEVDLRKLGIDVPDDPTMGNKAEGDIATPNFKNVMRDESGMLARNSIRQPYRKWPNNEIPYALSSQYGAYSRSIIAKAMNEYHMKTCVRFVARDARRHRDYVYIHPDDGCYSLVGRVGGRQPLSLDSGCIQVGTIVHELMHAVGFFHEQSRYDRDQYIDIAWQNVIRGADDQFEKYGVNVIDQLHEPYDYGSIMHYGPYAFSSNGRRTIVPRRAGAHKMGQRVAFSDIDLRKINKLYQCSGSMMTATNRVVEENTPSTRTAIPQAPPSAPSTSMVLPSQISSGSITDESGGSAEEENGNSVDGESSANIFAPPFLPPPPPPPTATAYCADLNWRCVFWSIPALGYCHIYAEIRLRVCRASCGSCFSPPTAAPALRRSPITFDIIPSSWRPSPTVALPVEFAVDAPQTQRLGKAECADRSTVCAELSTSGGACLMPATQTICQRTCGQCIDDVLVMDSIGREGISHDAEEESDTRIERRVVASRGRIRISADDRSALGVLNVGDGIVDGSARRLRWRLLRR